MTSRQICVGTNIRWHGRQHTIAALIMLVMSLACMQHAYAVITFRAATSASLLDGATGTSLTITVPAGTVLNDVMVASIAVANSTVVVTAPAGWTSIQAVTQPSGNKGGSRLFTYFRVVTGAEPAGYSWTLSSTHIGAVGGIASFAGVHLTTPIDASAGSITASSLNHAAPSITTTTAGAMLVTAHEFGTSSTWTPPTGMTETVDRAAITPNDKFGISMEMNRQLLGAAGATGIRTATAANGAGFADNGATVSIALRPLPGLHHIRIEHDGSASTCAPEPITVKACADAACTTNYIETDVTGINLAPTGVGYTWTPGSTVSILAANGGENPAITLARSTAGTVTLGLTGTPNPAPANPYVCFNTATGTTGACGLAFTSNTFSFNVLNHISATRQVVSLTSCTAGFANTTRSVKFWSTYMNPATGTLQARIVAGTGNADCATGYSSMGTASGSSTSLNLAFGSGTAPQATFSVCYPDAGDVRVDTRYDGSAGTGDAGVVILGNDRFIAAPASFAFSNIACTTVGATTCAPSNPSGNNPAAANDVGAAFIQAGQPFGATVTARNNLATTMPNFGRETPAQTIELQAVSNAASCPATSSCLVAPSGGSAGAISSGAFTSSGAGTGAVSATNITWSEVGIIRLRAVNTAYLGTAFNPSGLSGNIGRFIPDHFLVELDSTSPLRTQADWPSTTTISNPTAAPATVINVVSTAGFQVGGKIRIPGAGAAGAAFTATVTAVDSILNRLTLNTAIGTALDGSETVISEWGSYMGEQFNAQFRLAAANLSGDITENYQGAFAKLNPTVSGNPLGFGAVSGATNLTSRLDVGAPATGAFINGEAPIVAPLAINRAAAPDGPYTAVKIGIAPTDSDGVRMAAYDLNVGGTLDRTSIMDPSVQATTEVRFGRVRMQHAHGSELRALPVPMAVEYFSGTGWQRAAEDNSTTFTLTGPTCTGGPPVTNCNWGSLAIARIRPNTLAASVTNPSLKDGNSTIVGFQPVTGNFGLALSAPGAGNAGSLRVTANVPPYLRYNWGAGTTYIDNPSSIVTFGIYKGSFIFLRENY